jgi:Tol biopolymer transport system component
MHRPSGTLCSLVLCLLVLMMTVPTLANTQPNPSPGPASPAAHPFAGSDAWIAFQTYQTDTGIGLVHPDGTDNHLTATDVHGEQELPAWSPDGTHLAFTTRGGETEPVYEHDLATDTSRQIFACEAPCLGDDEPAYSPDGKRISFIRALGPVVTSSTGEGMVPSDCGLWIGELISGAVTQITSNTDPPCDREYEAHWSPDGSQLTYWRDPYENRQPTGTADFVVNADGTNEHRLTDPALFAGSPDWSPDGAWIVFSTYPLLQFQCCRVSNLYRIHPNGSGMEQITQYADEQLRAAHPRYTPDGQWILFSSITPTTRSLWLIPAKGGEPIVIVQGGLYGHGTWQPNAGS